MPWSEASPPGPAKNVKDAKVRRACVKAANSALADGKTDAEAIQACIGAMKQVSAGTLFLELPEGMTDEALSDLVQTQGLGFVTLSGEPEQFEVEYEDGRMMALGSVPADVDFAQVRALYFRNAILAREETNRNKDYLPAEEIANLAKSIGGMPIDDEHEFEKVRGVFTKGKVVQGSDGLGAVSVDGLVWPQRFPEIAQELVEGKRQLSMEVWIAAATCGLCSETFQHANDYCAHLEHKEARRTLRGVQGFGGALTVKPAGSDTAFDHDSMMVVASHRMDNSDPLAGGGDQTKGANDMELEEKIAQLEQELAATKDEATQLKADLETANTALATATANLEAAAEATDELKWSIRAQKLAEAGYDEAELETNKETLAAMEDVAFDILVGALESSGADPPPDPSLPVGGSVNLGGGGTGNDSNEEIVLILV